MVSYQAPAFRPVHSRVAPRPQISSRNLSGVGDMNIADWLLLGGGAVVGGAGINGIVSQFRRRKFEAIGTLFSVILTGVGVTVFIDKFGKLVA